MSARIRDGGAPRRRMLRIGLRICLIVAALLLVSAGSFFAYYAYCKWRADEAVGQAKASLREEEICKMAFLVYGLRSGIVPTMLRPIALLPRCLRLPGLRKLSCIAKGLWICSRSFWSPSCRMRAQPCCSTDLRRPQRFLMVSRGRDAKLQRSWKSARSCFSSARAPIWLLRSIASCLNVTPRIGVCGRRSPLLNCKAVPNRIATLHARRWKRLRPTRNWD